MNTDGKSIDASTLVAVDDVVSLLILAPTGWLLLRGLLLRISRFTGTLTIHLNRRRNIRLPMRRIMDRTMAILAGCNPGSSCSNLRMRIIHSLENRCIHRQLVLRQVQRSSVYEVCKISGLTLKGGCGPEERWLFSLSMGVMIEHVLVNSSLYNTIPIVVEISVLRTSYSVHCMLLYMVLCRSSSTLFRASRVSNSSLLQLLSSFFLSSILSFLLFLAVPVFRLKTKKKAVVSSSHWSDILGVPAIQPTYPLEPAPPSLLPEPSPLHTLFFRRRRLLLLLPSFLSGFKYIYFPSAVATIACPNPTPIALRRPHASAPPQIPRLYLRF